jgi:2-oxoglutarate dehydrogenase E2 component (dihydrolipoamide succinyltransferase)
MSLTIELPALGESVVEGTVTRWLVREGERVSRDQPLVEVTTDKVDAEIPAPEDGVVEKILVAEGETVAVGGALLMLAVGGEAARVARSSAPRQLDRMDRDQTTSPPGQAGRPSSPPGQMKSTGVSPQAPEGRAQRGGAERSSSGRAAAQQPTPQAPEGRAQRGGAERSSSGRAAAQQPPRPTPVAKKLAAAEGVDLARVEATGPGGRTSKADVARAASQTAAPLARPAASHGASGQPAYLHYEIQPGDKVIPMTPLRRIVAEHMVLSKHVSPHVGTVAEIDLGRVVALRDRAKRAFREQHGFNLTFLPFVVHAAVRALREHPRLNASVVDDAIVEKRAIHVGVAVETEKGLVVPVVRDADRLSLVGLATAIEDLSGRARNRQLSPDELRGGTFTVSNPGRHGNLYGFAIINQPQVGILRMGEVVKRPVVREIDGEDAIAIRPIMHLALSYDHRAVDGAPANAFLHAVRELLEAAELEL